MKKNIKLFLIFISLNLFISAQKVDQKNNSPFSIQYNIVFKGVTIGTQVWMEENLNVFYFRNGDPIPIVKTEEDWKKAGENKQPACCYYENKSENGKKYGVLYNWYAVKDLRQLAPVGWHIPNNDEWIKITDFLGGKNIAGTKIKTKEGWSETNAEIECNTCKNWTQEQKAGETCVVCNDKRKINSKISGNGTNESGFNALPGGYRKANGSFAEIENSAYWWSFTEYDTESAWCRSLSSSQGNLYRGNGNKEGLSVRCVKD